MNKTAIKCSCGQRIGQKDVMQTGYYMRMFGPSFVYVKFRCSRCKKLGEQFVKQEDWEEGILKEPTVELVATEKERFETLGPIEIREMADFHRSLDMPDILAEISAEFGKSNPSDASEK